MSEHLHSCMLSHTYLYPPSTYLKCNIDERGSITFSPEPETLNPSRPQPHTVRYEEGEVLSQLPGAELSGISDEALEALEEGGSC